MKLSLTTSGLEFLLKSLQGGPAPEFCKIAFGSGNDAGESAIEMSNPVKELDIYSITRKEDYVSLVSVLDNTEITERFKATELGVYITDKTSPTGVTLYAYGYSPEDEAALIPAASDYLIETEEIIMVYVGNAENVKAILSDSSLFATKADVERLKQNLKTMEDISEDFFIDVNSSYVFKEKKIYKQGNLIHGYINVEGFSEWNQCWLDINPKYKPVTFLDFIVPARTEDYTDILAFAQIFWIGEHISMQIEPVDKEQIINGIAISFSYMCETHEDILFDSQIIWMGTKDEYNSLSNEQKGQHDVYFIEEGS